MKDISTEIEDLKYEIKELKSKIEKLKHNNQQIIDNCYNLNIENKTIGKILEYAIRNNKILRDKDMV